MSKPADLGYITAVGIFYGTGRGTLIVQFKDRYFGIGHVHGGVSSGGHNI